jgi:hypothetical protein
MSEYVNSQDLLWAIAGTWFWRGYALVCAAGGLLWFRFILTTRARDALTVARLIMLGGFILGAFVRVNSACEPLSGALLATGAAFSAVLISCNWCGRHGSAWDKIMQMVRESGYGRHPDYSRVRPPER